MSALNAFQKEAIKAAETLQKAVNKLEDLKAELSWHQEMAKRIEKSSMKEVQSIVQQAQNEYNYAVEASQRAAITEKDLEKIRDAFKCPNCGTRHPSTPALRRYKGLQLCPDCDDYKGAS